MAASAAYYGVIAPLWIDTVDAFFWGLPFLVLVVLVCGLPQQHVRAKCTAFEADGVLAALMASPKFFSLLSLVCHRPLGSFPKTRSPGSFYVLLYTCGA